MMERILDITRNQYRHSLDMLYEVSFNVDETDTYKCFVEHHCIEFHNRWEFVTSLCELISKTMHGASCINYLDRYTDNYATILSLHKIVNVRMFRIGYCISNAYNNSMTGLLTQIKHILSNIHILYNNYKPLMCPRCTYLIMCYLAYERMSIVHYWVDILIYTDYMYVSLNYDTHLREIRVLQKKYKQTGNPEYLNLLEFLVCTKTGVFVSMNEEFKKGFRDHSRIYALSNAEKQSLYTTCSHTVGSSYIYTDSDVGKSYKIQLIKANAKQIPLTDKDKEDVTIDNVYKTIGRRYNSYIIYKHIIDLHFKHIHTRDIDIENIHKLIMNTNVNFSFARVIHTATLKYYLSDILRIVGFNYAILGKSQIDKNE